MKKILILSVSSGAGHTRAAQALQACARAHPANVQATHLDVMDFVPTTFRTLYTDFYIKLVTHHPAIWNYLYQRTDEASPKSLDQRIRRAVERLNCRALLAEIRRQQPDAIICTHFLPAELLARERRKNRVQAPVWVQVTDFDLHSMWVVPGMQGYFAASAEIAWRMRERGLPAQAVHVSGIPVMPEFGEPHDRAACAAEFGLDPQRLTILMMSGGVGLAGLDALAARLLAIDAGDGRGDDKNSDRGDDQGSGRGNDKGDDKGSDNDNDANVAGNATKNAATNATNIAANATANTATGTMTNTTPNATTNPTPNATRPASFQLIALAGKNQAMLDALRALARAHPGRLLAQGFTERVDKLMACSDLVITKPGGLTTSECLAMGLPMIVNAPIPGQEERNADFLLEQGVALKAIDACALEFRVRALLRAPQKLDAMRRQSAPLGRPHAARFVLERVLAHLGHLERDACLDECPERPAQPDGIAGARA